MQVPILNGTYSDVGADFRTAYPRNMVPVPKNTGIAAGYLRTAEGLVRFDSGAPAISGSDRGGILWNGTVYRVIGSKLVTVSSTGVVSILGDVGSGGRVTLDYSFDRLAISSGGNLYYWNGSLTQVTDADLGVCNDVIFIDGYFMSTDGEFLVVTELNDPTQVDPLKYGSSEVDPDPIKGLMKFRNEVYAFNRYTTEVFDNIGGTGFPFQRIDGAMVPKGIIGKDCKCAIAQSLAILGSGRGEAPGVYLINGGSAEKVSTREIDDALSAYTEAELESAVLESRKHRNHDHLYIHLPNETWVFDLSATQAQGEPVWFALSSDSSGYGAYRARNFVYAYSKWLCGDTVDQRIGYLSDDVSTHYGSVVGSQFDTTLIYNEGRSAIIRSMELIGLPGRAELGDAPVVYASRTEDGLTYSDEKPVSIGNHGQYTKRMQWRSFGRFRLYCGVRFRFAHDSIVAFTRLECDFEGLSV